LLSLADFSELSREYIIAFPLHKVKLRYSSAAFLPQFVAVYRGWREIDIRYSWEILFTGFHGHYARVALCRVLNTLTF